MLVALSVLVLGFAGGIDNFELVLTLEAIFPHLDEKLLEVHFI